MKGTLRNRPRVEATHDLGGHCKKKNNKTTGGAVEATHDLGGHCNYEKDVQVREGAEVTRLLGDRRNRNVSIHPRVEDKATCGAGGH